MQNRERTLPLTIRCDARSLAGVVQYLSTKGDPVRTKSEAVGAAVDLCYATLVATKKIAPIETTEQALAIFEVHGLGPQSRERLGARRTASLISSEEEAELELSQQSGLKPEVARRILAAEKAIGMESITPKNIVEPPTPELLAELRRRGVLEGE